MTRAVSIITLASIMAGAIAIYQSAFVVKETEQAVVTQFGKIIGPPIKTPGLHFKVPLIQKAVIFPKTQLQWRGGVERMPTLDKTYLMVGAFARWRIENPVFFIQAVGPKVQAADRFIEDILGAAVRNAVSSNPLVETVRNRTRAVESGLNGGTNREPHVYWSNVRTGREELVNRIISKARPKLAGFGIHLAGLNIDRLNYAEEVLPSVFDKMIAERRRIAARIKAQGRAEALKIEGEKLRDLKEITSAAYRKAQAVKGKADAAAARIYAAAYGRDPEFYWFYGVMDAYRNSFGADTTLVLSTESAFLKYLKHYSPQ